jgi:hypothetical protein
MIRIFLGQLSIGVAALLTLFAVAPASAVEMTFYGNQHFKFVSDEGKVILINPWVKGNKDAPMTVDSYKKATWTSSSPRPVMAMTWATPLRSRPGPAPKYSRSPDWACG